MSQNWQCRELESVTDSLVCLYGADGCNGERRRRRRESGCQRGKWQRHFLSSGATCGLWCAIVTGHFFPFHVILSSIVCFLPIDLLCLILLKVIHLSGWWFLCSLMLFFVPFSLSFQLAIFSISLLIFQCVCVTFSTSSISCLLLFCKF